MGHAGEFWIQDNENNDNDGGTTTTSTINGSSTSSTSTHTTRSTIRDTTNMHDTYISQISASSGHYVPTKNHVRWFQHWMKTSAYNTSRSSSSSSSIKKHHHLLKHQQQQELNIESIYWTERNLIK